MRIRYFMDDNGGDDDEVGSGHLVTDNGTLSVDLGFSSYDSAPLLANGTVAVDFIDGLYFLVAIVTNVIPDEGSLGVDLLDGLYLAVVVPSSLTESTSIAVDLVSGIYDQVVMSDSESEATSLQTDLLSGSYTLVIVPAPSVTEQSSNSVGFSSGVYA